MVSRPPALRPGMPVGSHVRLKRKLADGGEGSVWAAEHLTLHTDVAVKFALGPLDEESVLRFRREAVLAAQIKSQHVVRVFDHGFIRERLPYTVMELLEGEDLAARLRRCSRLSPAETEIIVRQICRALSAAHEKGLIHRDIKPGNVFLTQEDGELLVKVLDFGIAKKSGDASGINTLTGVTIGTPQYMSPEQALSSRNVDFRCDLWAVSIVAYECLTGKVPMNEKTLAEYTIALKRRGFQAPCALRPELPAAVDAFFARALEPDPNRRFGSARELARELETALSDAIGTPAEKPHSPSESNDSENDRTTIRARERSPLDHGFETQAGGRPALVVAPRLARAVVEERAPHMSIARPIGEIGTRPSGLALSLAIVGALAFAGIATLAALVFVGPAVTKRAEKIGRINLAPATIPSGPVTSVATDSATPVPQPTAAIRPRVAAARASRASVDAGRAPAPRPTSTIDPEEGF